MREVITLIGIVVYIILFTCLLCLACNKLFNEDRKFSFLIMEIVFIAYMAISVLNTVRMIVPNAPDAQLYKSIIEGSIFDNTEYADSNVTGYKLLVTPIKLLCFNNSLVYTHFAIFLCLLGVMLIWASWVKYRKNDVTGFEQRFYLCACFVYPAMVYFNTIPMREPLIIFAFGLFIYGFFKYEKLRFNFPLFFGAIILVILRRSYVFVVAGAVFIGIVYPRKKKGLSTFLLVFLILVLLVITSVFSITIINITLSPSGLASYRNYQSANVGLISSRYPFVQWNSWLDVLKDFPGLFAQFNLAPLPIITEGFKLMGYGYILDALFVLLLFVIILFNIKKIVKNKLWLVIILMFMGFSSMYEFYVTGAVRHRMPAILMLIAMVPICFRKKAKVTTLEKNLLA